MAYLHMSCPHCNHNVDYVYVQIGQLHCCKKCNQEFSLQPRRTNYFAFIAIAVGIVLALATAGFVVVRFFNWYVYRK